MREKIAINIVIEREKVGKKEIFMASSPDINVLAEGKTIDEAKKRFVDGLKIHLKAFPEERPLLVIEKKEEYEMPMVSKIFL